MPQLVKKTGNIGCVFENESSMEYSDKAHLAQEADTEQ